MIPTVSYKKALTKANVKITVFGYVTPCGLVRRGTYTVSNGEQIHIHVFYTAFQQEHFAGVRN
jgi:hypothetical protein